MQYNTIQLRKFACAKRGVGQVAVTVGVCLEAEGWEVYEHFPEIVVVNEATPWLLRVCAQTVEGSVKSWDVQRVADHDDLAI